MRFLLAVCCLFGGAAPASGLFPEESSPGAPWKALPVQHQGRVKPFDTMAREVLRTVSGRETFQGRSAVEAVLSWMIIPELWDELSFVLVENFALKEALGLDPSRRRFPPKDFIKNRKKLELQLTELQSLRQKGEDLDGYFKSLARLETKLILYYAAKKGDLLRIQPPPEEGAAQSLSGRPEESQPPAPAAPRLWLSAAELTGDAKAGFQEAVRSYIGLISRQAPAGSAPPPAPPAAAAPAGDSSEGGSAPPQSLPRTDSLKGALERFQAAAFAGEPEKWLQPRLIKAEVFYNSLKPFQKAWILYLLFLILALPAFLLKKSGRVFLYLAPVFALGFASHTLGLGLRAWIMGRPPVSNMYETVVWVPWAAVLAGMGFLARGSRAPFLAAAILGFFCLFLSESAPQALDSSLQPLEAVLRSSFWLSTHVLVITMSYSFFFLAFVLGDMALVSFLAQKKQGGMAFVRKMSAPIYRCLQWGITLLAAGTILGAIWADYSWGRFWGWDPKESWALVSLLAYLALLHGRLAGWIREMGMAIGSVLMFFLVIMAWYGVNFLLGAGLHSYGFGTGGAGYVAGFLAIHLLLCGAVWLKLRGKLFLSRA